MPREPYLPAGHHWGWDRDAEDWDEIKARESSIEPVMAMGDEFSEVRRDPRPLIRNQSQRSWPSCRGHSLSNSVEWIHMLATGDAGLQFSRQFCWQESQRITWGRASRSRGATMSAGWKLARDRGVCEESSVPYTFPNYDNRTPDAAWANAAKWKIRQRYPIRSYEEARQFLGSGQGAIDAGVSWNSSLSRAGARVESYSRRRGGGHAICFLSLSDVTDRDGQPYIWLVNSHGTRYGSNGSTQLSPKAFQQVCDHSYTTMAGLSDLSTPAPRDWVMI